MNADEEVDYFSQHCDLLDDLFLSISMADLSLSKVQEKIKSVPSHVIRDYYKHRPFFHWICINRKITFDVVEYVINEFPGMN